MLQRRLSLKWAHSPSLQSSKAKTCALISLGSLIILGWWNGTKLRVERVDEVSRASDARDRNW